MSGSAPLMAGNMTFSHEKLVPDHPVMKQFFRGADFWHRLEDVTTSVLPIKSVHDRFDIKLKPGTNYDTLGSSLPTLYHLRLLIQLMQCRTVLEIGTFVGASTMFLADALGSDGHVVTVEIGEEFASIARTNFERNGFRDKITLVEDDVMDAVPLMLKIGFAFDLIFLDGSKQDYGVLLKPLLELLNPGGLLFVDNVFFHGDALNEEPTTDKARGVQSLLQQAKELADYAKVILPYSDGHLLLLKPRNA